MVVCVFEEIFWNFRPMHGEVKQFDETILQLGGKKTPRVSFLHVFTTNLCHTSAIENVFFARTMEIGLITRISVLCIFCSIS